MEEITAAPLSSDIFESPTSFGIALSNYHYFISAPHKVNPKFKYMTLYDKKATITPASLVNYKRKYFKFRIKPKKMIYKRDHDHAAVGDYKQGSLWLLMFANYRDVVSPHRNLDAQLYGRMTFATSD